MPRKANKKSKHVARQPAETAEELAPQPSSNDSNQEQRFHFFWKSGSPFSQWHTSQYQLNGFVYSCAEQGMMHGKALLFEDHEMAANIMNTKSPRSMLGLGRKVRGFSPKVWNRNRERIVYANSVAKFTQNPHLLEALMNTEGWLVEASPRDAIWGIGLAEDQASNVPQKHWPGLNLLGQILTQVRDEIRAGVHDELLPARADQELSSENQDTS